MKLGNIWINPEDVMWVGEIRLINTMNSNGFRTKYGFTVCMTDGT
jgi:hypothetical protein